MRVEVSGRPRAAGAIALSAGAAGALWFAPPAGDGTLGTDLFWVLLGAAVLAALLTTRVEGVLVVSATFTMSMLAVAFLGPAAAFAIIVVAEVAEGLVVRYRTLNLPINIAVAGLPNLIGATLFPESVAHDSTAFPFVLTGFAVGCL